ncbi:MAG: 4Fe-4S dicluster domain-containing protein [Terracidiphilus sp.]
MRSAKPSKALLAIASLFTVAAAGGAACLWLRIGQPSMDIALFGLGFSEGPCLAAYALAPSKLKQRARRLVLFTGGLSILAFSLLASANLDLEGFFLLLFEGAMGIAIGHTLATLLVGPLFFGRILCGWGCWRAMVLELLPVGRGKGRRIGVWRFLPLAGMATVLAAAALSFFVFGHRAGGVPGSVRVAGAKSLLIGFGIYYAASIGLAFAMNDQRAFCKYLCPSAVILRLTSRASLLKMATDRQVCNGCGACSRVCPMDIDVRAFAVSGRRVLSGECILCQRCAQVCPAGAVAPCFGLDVARGTPFFNLK